VGEHDLIGHLLDTHRRVARIAIRPVPPGLGELLLELGVLGFFEPLRLVQIRGLKRLFDLGLAEGVARVGPDLTCRIRSNALVSLPNCPTSG